MFLTWLDLLPQMQALNTVYFQKGTVTRFVYRPQKLDQKSNFWRSVFLWLNILLNLN